MSDEPTEAEIRARILAQFTEKWGEKEGERRTALLEEVIPGIPEYAKLNNARVDIAVHPEHLKFYIGQLQAVDEFAVCQIIHPGGGIDSGYPESPEITFARAAVAIGIHQGLINGIGGSAKQFAATGTKSFGKFQHLFAASSGFKSSFNSHFIYLTYVY